MIRMLTMFFLALSTCNVARSQNHLHDVTPPDPEADYATVPFCGYSGISVGLVKEVVGKDGKESFLARALKKLRIKEGVFVLSVFSGSAAELLGMQAGDVISQINGVRVRTLDESQMQLDKFAPPASVSCLAQRSYSRGNRIFWKSYRFEISTTSYLTACLLATDTNHDEVDNTTIVSHKDMPNRQRSSYVDLQAVQMGDEPATLRICFNYSADEWLFVRSAKLICDGETLEFPFRQPLRDNDGGRIWEHESFMLSNSQVEQIRKIILAQSDATVRFTGEDYYRDVEIAAKDLHRMIAVHDRWAINEGKPMIATLKASDEARAAVPEPVANPVGKPRVFSDSTGAFQITATFVGLSGESVTLEKEDGKQAVLPITRLSEADQKWVKDAIAAKPE